MEQNIMMSFSVAMCVYGGDNADFFKSAVDSVLCQTVMPSEIVLTVDGPVPQKLDNIIKEYEKNDIFKVIRFAENQGHGNARRASVGACTNELVALMDADDISSPNRFEQQLKYFNKHDADIVGGNIAEFIGDIDNVVAYRIVCTEHSEIVEYAKKRCPMNQMTVMFKKSIYELAGGYIDWYWDEDYYLWLRMIFLGAKFGNTDAVLCKVRVGEEMYRRRGSWRYFKSELKLQNYMLKNKFIGTVTWFVNVCKRFVVQVALPNKLRGWVFKKIARTSNLKG